MGNDDPAPEDGHFYHHRGRRRTMVDVSEEVHQEDEMHEMPEVPEMPEMPEVHEVHEMHEVPEEDEEVQTRYDQCQGT